MGKRRLPGLVLTLGLMAAAIPAADAIDLQVNGAQVEVTAQVRDNTTYVALRQMSQLLWPGAQVDWRDGQAVVQAEGLDLTARPGDLYLQANGRALYIAGGVRVENGTTLVPVRVLAQALGAQVDWDPATGLVTVESGEELIASADEHYDEESLYWLSRIISAESRGEPLLGKIAVGNVVLNRVAHQEFPDSIYDVIFDDRWGGQFEPVRNGTVYDEPTEESVLAAKLCLDGAVAVERGLYFIAPDKATNFWTMENRPYITTIGCHWFYA